MDSTELSEYAYERDRHEFSLGDTLDIKTGILPFGFVDLPSASIYEHHNFAHASATPSVDRSDGRYRVHGSQWNFLCDRTLATRLYARGDARGLRNMDV